MTNEELVQLYQDGYNQALEAIIEQNRGIIYKLVNRMYVEGTSYVDREDLEQEGIIGLITAANKYDLNNPKKAKFITYAVYWIQAKINRFINTRCTNEEVSLNTLIGQDEDTELMDYIEGVDYSFENVEEKLYRQQLQNELEELMYKYNTLREREILKLRYGWNNMKCMTCEEVGELFNIAGKSIRRIEYRAMDSIRHTPWGIKKADEIYKEKASKGIYNTDEKINVLDYKQKYLNCKSLSNEYLDTIIKGGQKNHE